MTILAQEFVATLQILQADLAAKDLCLLPTTVQIELVVYDGSEITHQEIPNNEVAEWRLSFPHMEGAAVSADEVAQYVLAIATTVLAQSSVLPHDQFFKLLEDSFREGLSSKTFVVRPARELFSGHRYRKAFEAVPRTTLTPPPLPPEFRLSTANELRWRDGPGPDYSAESAEQFLQNRYSRIVPPIRLTLPRLLNDRRTNQLILTLKKDGYLDWQILNVIASSVINFRLRKNGAAYADEKTAQKVYGELLNREERPDDEPYDLNDFSEETIETQKNLLIASVLNTWGLVPHNRTPQFSALKKFLDARYRNSSDDIPHEDYFGPHRAG